MVRKTMTLFAFLLTIGLAAGGSVAAQTPVSDTADVSGLESSYLRTYAADVEQPVEGEQFGAQAGVFTFDSPESVEGAFDAFADDFALGFFGEDADVESSDVDGVGDNAREYVGEADLGGEFTPMTVLMVQQENMILLSISLGIAESGSADDIAQFMIDAEPSDSEVMFSDDGTSTGGAFDLMPAAGDEVLGGMVPVLDMDLGLGSASPEASPEV